MAKLVIFSGPPGVGKSTLSYKLAQKTGWALITRDCIDSGLEKAN
jgi:adenylate kinase family enzyme